MAIATDRETFEAATRQYEHAERCIEDWAFERRRRVEQIRAFHAATTRAPRSSSNAERASEAINVFHRKRSLSHKERARLEAREEHERARKRNERKAAESERRGSGPVRKCAECQTIYRGDDGTCGCRPCAHCTTRFRGAGFKCEACKADPDLITARGTQTRANVPSREAQPMYTPYSDEAKRMDILIDQKLPRWMAIVLEERYLEYKQTDHKAAENLMIAVPVFTGRLRAAVARVAELLANDETARV